MKNLPIIGLIVITISLSAFKADAKKNGDNKDCNPENPQAQSYSTSGGGGGTLLNPNYFIPVDSANKMLQSYLVSINADVDTNQNLQSIILDADAIREYLSNPSIRKVKVMFAHRLDYINSGHFGVNCGYTSGGLTIILAGFDANNNYIFAPGDMVPDRGTLCPPGCVNSGTASDMYLH